MTHVSVSFCSRAPFIVVELGVGSKLTYRESHYIEITRTKKYIEKLMAQHPLTLFAIKLFRNRLSYFIYSSLSYFFTSSSCFFIQFIVETLKHWLFMTNTVFKLFLIVQHTASLFFVGTTLLNELFFIAEIETFK